MCRSDLSNPIIALPPNPVEIGEKALRYFMILVGK